MEILMLAIAAILAVGTAEFIRIGEHFVGLFDHVEVYQMEEDEDEESN